MAYDMGTAVGTVELNITDVNKKTRQISVDFEQISEMSDAVASSVENQAKIFETVLSRAYKEAAQSLTPMQKANLSLDKLFAENKEKVDIFAKAAKAASDIQVSAQRRVVQTYKAWSEAQENINKKYEEYNNLRQSGSHYDLSQKEQAYLDALNKEYQLKLQLILATAAEEDAIRHSTEAKDAYQKTVAEVAQVEKEAQEAMKKFSSSEVIKLQQANEARLNGINRVRSANKQESDERKRQTSEIIHSYAELQQAAEKLSTKQVAQFAIITKAVDEVVNGIKRLAQEMVNLSKQVVDIGADFETSMAQVAATSGMTALDVSGRISDYQDLVNAAKEAGLTTIFSASQAGEALNYLALAGYNVEQSIETMPDILTIAAAGAMDLGRASDMVTDAMNALDLGIGNTSDFIDKMAKTAQSSNTNVEQLGNAILTVGGTATVLAGGVTELDTAIGLLANSGIKARVGGTALRQILLNLTAPSSAAKEKIEELGLQVFDTAGNLRPLNEIFKDLGDIMEDFSDQQRMEALNAIFDARQIRAANALIQGAGDAWDNLYNKINNANGAAEKMAETMRSNLNGAVNIAKSNLENIAITLYEGIQKNITSLVKEAIPKFQELNESLANPKVQTRLKDMSARIAEIGNNLLDKVVKFLPNVVTFLSEVETHFKSLAIAVSSLWVAINYTKLVNGVVQIFALLRKFHAFLLENPYAVLAVAIAEVIALVIELDNAFTQYYKDMAAQVREETDVWKQQRTAVANVVEEWNNYTEQAEKASKETEVQADKVKLLYAEYKRLYEAGEDTTLAMESLAQEIPEVNKMLEEGTTSFEGITKAVDEYTEALIRNAKIEANRNLYIQAVETQARAQQAYNDVTKAIEDNEKALKDAEQAVEDYSNKFNDPNFAWDIDELERRKEAVEALKDTHDELITSQAEAKVALNSATKAMEQAEADYTEHVRGEAHARGEIFIGEAEGAKAAGEAYAEQRQRDAKKAAKVEKKHTEALISSLDAGVAEVDRHIALRDAGYDDQAKIDFYKNWFGTHKDWDKNNEELVKHYDTYMSLVEKKEKELQDELDRQQKERDKIAKENADALKKSIEDSLSTIDWYAGLTGATAAQQAQQVRQFVNDNISYYKQYPDEYEKVVRKIVGLDKQWLSNTDLTATELEKYLRDIEGFYKEYFGEDSEAYKALVSIVTDTQAQRNKEVAEEYFKNWTDGYNKLADKASKAYQDIEKSRDSFEKSLLSGVELFSESNEKVWNRFSQQYEDQKGMIVDKKAYRDATKQLQDLQKTMDSLQAKGLDEGILNELWGMSPEEALEKANELNKLSTSSIGQLNADYQAYITQAEGMTQKYYDAQVKDWEEKYWNPLVEYTKTGQADLKNAMALVGEDTVNGFIEGLQSKVDSADEGTKQIMEDVLNTAKETLGIHSPSTIFYEVGENTIQGFLNGIQSKIESIANIFVSLGQKAGDSFVNAFRETWDNFVALMNTTGGFAMPQAMVATAYGTPAFAGGQMVYNGIGATTSTGLTRDDVTAAVKDALPSGNVILTIDQTEFARVSRNALNSLAENSEMGLNV